MGGQKNWALPTRKLTGFWSSLRTLDSGLEAQVLWQLVKAAEDRRQFEAIFEQRESAQLSQVVTCHDHSITVFWELISLPKVFRKKKKTSVFGNQKLNDLPWLDQLEVFHGVFLLFSTLKITPSLAPAEDVEAIASSAHGHHQASHIPKMTHVCRSHQWHLVNPSGITQLLVIAGDWWQIVSDRLPGESRLILRPIQATKFWHPNTWRLGRSVVLCEVSVSFCAKSQWWSRSAAPDTCPQWWPLPEPKIISWNTVKPSFLDVAAVQQSHLWRLSESWSLGDVVSSGIIQGLVNVPMFHITQLLGI